LIQQVDLLIRAKLESRIQLGFEIPVLFSA